MLDHHLSSFPQKWFIGQKNVLVMPITNVSQLGVSATYPVAWCVVCWCTCTGVTATDLAQSRDRPTTPSLTSSISVFPRFPPWSYKHAQVSDDTFSLLFLPTSSPSGRHIFGRDGLGFAAETIKHSSWLIAKNVALFHTRFPSSHLGVCSL